MRILPLGLKKTDFVVFKNAVETGGTVRAIVAKNAASTYTRKKIDKLTEHAKGIGAKGLAYIRWADEAPTCSFNKFLKDGELDELTSTLNVEKGRLRIYRIGQNKRYSFNSRRTSPYRCQGA